MTRHSEDRPRPRVMVSSVVQGFEAARAAARRGITVGGGQPILVNEDFPALATSPRNACLDAVDSSDVLLVIVGERAGYIAPSGKPVVEEEYERAIARGIPVIAFVQDGVAREPEAERLEKRISDYVGGRFRMTFTSDDQLERQVAEAVTVVVNQLEKPVMNPSVVAQKVVAPIRDDREVILRTVIAPLRDEEVVDVLRFGQRDFQEALVNLGTSQQVGLFSHWKRKTPTVRGDSLIIEQESGDEPPYQRAVVEIDSRGVLVVDSNVTGRTVDKKHAWVSLMQIVESDVEAALAEHFGFAHALYEHVDPYQRQYAFGYNCALHGAGYHRLVRHPHSGGSISLPMRENEPVVVYGEARRIGRAVLGAPTEEITRVMAMLRRRMSE